MLRPGIVGMRGSMAYGHTTTAMHEIAYISPVDYTPPPLPSPGMMLRAFVFQPCRRGTHKANSGLRFSAFVVSFPSWRQTHLREIRPKRVCSLACYTYGAHSGGEQNRKRRQPDYALKKTVFVARSRLRTKRKQEHSQIRRRTEKSLGFNVTDGKIIADSYRHA